MDIALPPHTHIATAYLDDVVIYSATWQDHLFHLDQFLQVLRQAGLTANPRKCHLGLTETQYLEYSIREGLLKPQECKVEAVCQYSHTAIKKQ